jgi:hypothetical protein
MKMPFEMNKASYEKQGITKPKLVAVPANPQVSLMSFSPNKILFDLIILQKIKLSIDKTIFTCTFTPTKKK